jgi:hypothetical protein
VKRVWSKETQRVLKKTNQKQREAQQQQQLQLLNLQMEWFGSPAPKNERDPRSPAETNETEFYNRCFFIFDDLYGDEMAKEDELVLYFYPPEVPLNKKLFILGGCHAMISFAKNFTKGPAEVVRGEHVKFAVKELGKVVMVLAGDVLDTDDAITQQLNSIYNAFMFFNGSFDRVLEVMMKTNQKERNNSFLFRLRNSTIIQRCNSSRKMLLEEMKRLCSELLPLTASYHKNPLRAFITLPFTELSPVHYTRFLSFFLSRF